MSHKSIRTLFPFKVGCTSYVYPDDILPNVRKMRDIVDDIEIILFESEALSNLPDKDIIKRLARFPKQYGITYTIHFPVDVKAGSGDLNERSRYVEQVLKIIKLTEPLKPFAYLMHLEGIRASASEQEITEWQKNCDEVCHKIASVPEIDHRNICIENLDYPVEWHAALVRKYGFSMCMDVGHLWRYGRAWEDTLNRYLHQVRVIHLHGVYEERDHISLKYSKLDDIKIFYNILIDKKYKNLVTLELFDEKDTFESIEIMRLLCLK